MIMRISNGMDFWWKQPRERERKKKSEKENQLDKEETALGKWCIMPARENRRGDREKVE